MNLLEKFYCKMKLRKGSEKYKMCKMNAMADN